MTTVAPGFSACSRSKLGRRARRSTRRFSNVMDEIAFDGCVEYFAPYVGLDYENSKLEVTTLRPTYKSWHTDREATKLRAIFSSIHRDLNCIDVREPASCGLYVLDHRDGCRGLCFPGGRSLARKVFTPTRCGTKEVPGDT
jgi:hypothetical protein